MWPAHRRGGQVHCGPGLRRCEEILTRCRPQLELTAQYLLTHETMSGETFARVFTDPDGEEFTALPSQK